MRDPAGALQSLQDQMRLLAHAERSGLYHEPVLKQISYTRDRVLAAIRELRKPQPTDERSWILEQACAALTEMVIYLKTGTCPPEGVIAERTALREPDPRPWPLLPDWYPRPMYD